MTTTTTSRHRAYDTTAATLWDLVGSFERYEWGAGVGPGRIGGDRPDDEVGAVRAFTYYGDPARQRLTAYADRSYSWESLEPFEDIAHYVQTIGVRSLGGGRSSLTWTAEFDADDQNLDRWSEFFGVEFEKSFDKLDRLLRGEVPPEGAPPGTR